MTKPRKICLWSSPRNISTAMMYSFAQRPDTTVYDEPLYAHYLKVTGYEHPCRQQILNSQCQDGEQVVKDIILQEPAAERPITFFKQMTHHLVDLNEDFLSRTTNIIFIRDPQQIITSYAEVIPNVTIQNIGIEKQWTLFNQLTSNATNENCLPIVLDSNEILKDPYKLLRKLCDVLEIPFCDQMLHWKAGPRPEDGVWAENWYNNVWQSTGFHKQKTSERTCPQYLLPLLEECMPFYERLYAHSLKA